MSVHLIWLNPNDVTKQKPLWQHMPGPPLEQPPAQQQTNRKKSDEKFEPDLWDESAR